MSQITTHVLDTSAGQPAEGIRVRLEQPSEKTVWAVVATGTTNKDGRVSDLLDKNQQLDPGTYQISFETGKYFKDRGIKTFYPEVTIIFQTFDKSHYHVPLLLNPFGYSTYRGS